MAIEKPDTRFARSGDVHIAYQTFGDGDVDWVGVPPFAQNLDAMWDDVYYRPVLERMASFLRVTHFDKRGTGLSDRDLGAGTIEERMDDFRAVMDAAGIDRAWVGGVSEGAPMALLFAATYPDRVEGLTLFGGFARLTATDGYRAGVDPGVGAQAVEALADTWGSEDSVLLPMFAPSLAYDADYAEWIRRYQLLCCSPGTIRQVTELDMQIDIREVVPLVEHPVLVMHRRDELVVPFACGEWLAEHLPNGQLLAVDGTDHVPWAGDADAWLDPMEEFVTGDRGSRPIDRRFATVMFTDIVDSTAKASAEGDAEWRKVLDRHDDVTRGAVERRGGRLVKTTGDGCLAAFDSPGRAIEAARQVRDAVRSLGIEVRCGLHAGEVETRGDDIGGIAVHIGARVQGLAGPSEVLVTGTVRDLVVGSGVTFEERGTHDLKGVEGDWAILAVAD